MNAAHLHLLINHLPILGALFALIILVCGMIFKSDHVKHVALIMVIVSSVFGVGTYLSGDEAEHEIEDMIAINHEALEEHEESGEIAMWALGICGAICLGTMLSWRKTGVYSKPLLYVCLVFLTISVAILIHTGKEGGLIRHSEILRTQFD